MKEVYMVYHSYMTSIEFDKECLKIKRWNAGFCHNTKIQQTMLYTAEDAQKFADLVIKYNGTLYKKVHLNGKVEYTKL